MKKTILIVLASVVALAALVAVFLLVQQKNAPETIAIRAIEGVFDDIAAKSEASTLAKALRGGSIEFSLNEMTNDAGVDLFEGIRTSGKLYFSEDAFMAKDISVFSKQVKLLAGNLYFSKAFFYLEESTILKDAFGVSANDFAEELDNSIFAPHSGTPYALSEELASALKNNVKENDLEKKTNEVVSHLLTELWELLCEHAEFEKSKEELLLDNEPTNVRMITVTLSPEALVSFLQKAYTLIEDNTDLRLLIRQYDTHFTLPLTQDEDTPAESWEAMFDDYLRDLEEWVNAYCKEITSSHTAVTAELATPSREDALLFLRIKQGVKTVLSLDLGAKGIKDASSISLTVGDATFSYEKKTATNLERTTLFLNGEKIFRYSVNPQGGAFDLSLEDGLLIKGILTEEEDKTTVEVQAVTLFDENGDEMVYEGKLEFIITPLDTMPQAPNDYKKLSDITVDMLQASNEKIAEGVFKKPCSYRSGANTKISFTDDTFSFVHNQTVYGGTYYIDMLRDRIYLTYDRYSKFADESWTELSTPETLGGDEGWYFSISEDASRIVIDEFSLALIS